MVAVNGLERVEAEGGTYLTLRREWKAGDVVSLSMPMTAQFVACHPFVEPNGGRVAIQRGPIVYCLEQVDNPDADVWFIGADVDSELTTTETQIAGFPVIAVQGKGFAVERSVWDGQLYLPLRSVRNFVKPVRFTAIPYFAWANRDAGPMTVWVTKA